nr:unnamed protein product [Spirometra erinaceieuropaei]
MSTDIPGSNRTCWTCLDLLRLSNGTNHRPPACLFLLLSAANDEDQDYTCPHCDRTFTSHIGLVGHLRIHRTETGEPVREAPTYTHRTRLHCPHCPRTFRHRMGLFGHMRIHESSLDRTPDTPTTPNTSTVHTPPSLHPSAPPPPAPPPL